MAVTGLEPELDDLAVALGILDTKGALRSEWFANPLAQAQGMLRDPARRAALGQLIDSLMPADATAPTDDAAGETWHPLTGPDSAQHVFLTVRHTGAGGLALGLAVRVATEPVATGPGATGPSVDITVSMGLVTAADDGLHAIVGTADGPVRVRADVTVDPTGAVGLQGVALHAELVPGAADPVNFKIEVRGLRIGGEVQPTLVLDPTRLGRDAVPVIQQLLTDQLTRLGSDSGANASGPLSAVVHHLLPLAGLGGDVPRLPVERIGLDEAVLGHWFATVVDSTLPDGRSSAAVWLGHLGGLLGMTTPVTGTGTEADPWSLRLADLGSGGADRLDLTLATRTGAGGRELLAGFALRLHGPAQVLLDASATLVSLPLSGPGTPRAVPSATAVLRAPDDPTRLLVDAGPLRIGFAQAGLRWDGHHLRPNLELGRVDFDGHHYELVDLSSVDSATAAAAGAVRDAIADALGAEGPGAQLAVLIGLVAPPGETGAPLIDPAALVSSPTRELARVHRARLVGADHSWAAMLGQIATLVGLTDPVAGAGSETDPWQVTVADVGPVALELVAWTDPATPAGSHLHLGLRVTGSADPSGIGVAASALVEVADLTLPTTGTVTTRLLARHRVRLGVTGPFTLAPVAGIGVTMQRVDVRLDVDPGQPFTPVIELGGVTVHIDDADVTLPSLALPPAGGFAPDQRDLGLGIPPADLDRLTRALLSRLWTSVAGDDAHELGGLLGLHRALDSLPDDWPGVALPAGGFGELLSDPLEALRGWVTRLALGLSADGDPFTLTLLDELNDLLHPVDDTDITDAGTPVGGAGTWNEPWRLRLTRGGGAELLLWLEPDGPPADWARAAAARITTGPLDVGELLDVMGRFGSTLPPLEALFGGPAGPARAEQLAPAFATMVAERSSGDGVVPLEAQLPDDPAWDVGPTLINAAHHRLPEHPDAIAQVLAQVGTLAPEPGRAVLLIGPSFTDRTSWQPLLSAAEQASAGSTSPDAHFDFRTAPSPDRADLTTVSAAVSWYTAELSDPGGDIAPVTAQVGAAVERIGELRTNVKVVIVAHSTAGLAARAYAASHPERVAGLITIGTPHGPAPLTVFDEPAQADALRLVARLLADRTVTGPMRDVVDHLLTAVEGWQATTGLPVARTYPRTRFAGESTHDTGGVRALALAGQITDDLEVLVEGALAGTLTAGATGRAPTHLGLGLRVGAPLPAPASETDSAQAATAIDIGVRVDAARIPLTAGASTPAHATRLDIEVHLDRPFGFVLDPEGGRGARVRRAELGVSIDNGHTDVRAVFHDAGVDAPTAAKLTLDDADADHLLSAVVAEAARQGAAGAALVDALVALGVAARNGSDAVVVLADAVEGLRADPGGYLGARARTAFASQAAVLGLTGPPGGPWTLAIPDLPLSVELTADRLTVRLAGLRLAGADLSAEVTRTRHDPVPRVSLSAAGSSVAVHASSAGPAIVITGSGSDPITLSPRPDPAALVARLGPLVVEGLVSSIAASALLDRLGPGFSIGAITEVLRDPVRALLVADAPAQPASGPPGAAAAGAAAAGAAGAAALIDGSRVAALLAALAELAGVGALTTDGLPLPGGLVLRASGEAGTPARLSLRTQPPLAVPGPAAGASGTLDLELDATFAGFTVAPEADGHVSLDVPLGGSWGSVRVDLGLDHGIVSLSITPTIGGSPSQPIVLLPHFGGLGPLAAGAAAALLPALLDALVEGLPTPLPPLAAGGLAVADALGIHGGPGDPSFAAHVPQIRALAQPDGLSHLATTALPAAAVALWNAAGLPGSVTATADGATIHQTVAGLGLTAEAAWGANPKALLRVEGLAAGPIAFNPLTVGFADGTVKGDLGLTVSLPPEADRLLGLHLAPSLRVEAVGGALGLRVLPLGPGTDNLLSGVLLPQPGLVIGAGGVRKLFETVAMPLATQVALDRFDLNARLFAGGPSTAEVLRSAAILQSDTNRLVVPLPTGLTLVTRLLGALVSTGAVIHLSDDLDLQLVTDRTSTPARLGLGLHGRADLGGSSVDASVRFGEKAPTWIPDPAPALRLLLLEEGTFALKPALRLAPVGLRLAGTAGAALLDTDDVHLGTVTAYLWSTLKLDGTFSLSEVGGAVDLEDFGLPLGAVASGAGGAGGAGSGSTNPVAASLLGSSSGGGSGGSGAGDPQAITPGLSLVAAKRPGSGFELLRRDADHWVGFAQRPLWFGIHRSFGPLAINQIGFAHLPAPAGSGRPGSAEVLVDGGVSVGPLTVEAHELGVAVPLDRLSHPGEWQLDLAGLAVAMQSDSVSMSGGLVKRPGPPVDYAGTVTVKVAGRTFTAVGAYARPVDNQGQFTSLFVFVGLPIVLGGPPFMFITGLAGGVGYNRRLLPPVEITEVPRFPLVTAIDDGLNNDPMGSLTRMGNAMPPSRGSFWMAAGIRFTSFSFVRSVAVLYVAMDRGVEIGLLGVAKASIPPPDAGAGSLELASVELALKARMSTAEGVLSIQAQLTDNSWLLSRDCQLTGGFAFFVWFRKDQFVLTLGGYHPSFRKPPAFPVVPRLGFHWAVSSAIVIKGQAYFALTSSCVMAGARLEVSFNKAGIYASFITWADFLIAWDPFAYDISAGASVTAGYRIRVCFFFCVTIDIHVTLGARVHILGPPFHGEVVLDLEICSVTVAFGNRPHAPATFLGWNDFRAKYVIAGAQDGSALSLHAADGLIPPETQPAADAPAPGTRNNPWIVAGTFSLHSETRLAATSFTALGVNGSGLSDGQQTVAPTVDLAPMNVAGVHTNHTLTVTSATDPARPVDTSRLRVTPIVGHVPSAVWLIRRQPTASADVLPMLSGLTLRAEPDVVVGDTPLLVSNDLVDTNIEPVPIGLLSPPRRTVSAAFATALAERQAAAPAPVLTNVAVGVLGEAGADTRVRAGLSPAAITALSARALRYRRSSPPLVAALSGGVSGGSNGGTNGGSSPTPIPDAPIPDAPTPDAPIPVEPVSVAPGPQLRATLRTPVAPPGPTSIRTTVDASDDRPRVSPPRGLSPDAPPLHRLGDVSSAPATRAPSTGRTLVASHLGSITPGSPHAGAHADALANTGVVLMPGEMHVWDLPGTGAPGEWLLSGPGAARIVFFDRAGAPLQDEELIPGGDGTDNIDVDSGPTLVTAPAGSASVVIRSLGHLPAGLASPQPGPGAVSLQAAPPGKAAVCGWQSGSHLALVGHATLLARGATLHLPAPIIARRDGLRTTEAVMLAATAVAGQPSCETTLPAAVDLVLVIVDALGSGDDLPAERPTVTVEGAEPTAEPTVIVAGHRLYLIYEIGARPTATGAPDQTLVSVQVALGDRWQAAGVLGLPGTVEHWTPTLTGGGARHLVADEAHSSHGPLTVRYRPAIEAGRAAPADGTEETS